ncbi:unnamed protein product [Didymodactylos carnosus]|uniref:Uncharacterized protein n=1 Tax=Didymodactylos carnosus TaxID=1234261 RepID=A0A814TJ60_9BILA|nr:unnamed protein product [Didymodactylos carnosus]CAF1162760.1 unnamed protein product [Didymodactylos carnosus]CAF3685091.1 unnamed protein product [Didymodactylos carnosus]CAF3926299.1 unnamed protein product [Didymodactylos carnosus]
MKDWTLICTTCKTDELDCGNKGWQSIEQHMSKNKHRENVKLIKGNATFINVTQTSNIQLQQPSTSSIISTATLTHPIKIISFQDQVTRAEAVWAINAAQHGYS